MSEIQFDMDYVDNIDDYVYYVDPLEQKCPKCGMIGSIMKSVCSSCGAAVVLNRELAGKKERKEVALARIKGKKPVKNITSQERVPGTPEEREVNFEISTDDFEDDDFHIKEPEIASQEEIAIQLLKKMKAMLKSSEELLAAHFVDVKITFSPFDVEVTRRPKPLKL